MVKILDYKINDLTGQNSKGQTIFQARSRLLVASSTNTIASTILAKANSRMPNNQPQVSQNRPNQPSQNSQNNRNNRNDKNDKNSNSIFQSSLFSNQYSVQNMTDLMNKLSSNNGNTTSVEKNQQIMIGSGSIFIKDKRD